MAVRWEYMQTQTIHQHPDQVPLMNGITASPNSVVIKRDFVVITEHAPPATSFPSNVSFSHPHHRQTMLLSHCHCFNALPLLPVDSTEIIAAGIMGTPMLTAPSWAAGEASNEANRRF
jgi:hypothetical protein